MIKIIKALVSYTKGIPTKRLITGSPTVFFSQMRELRDKSGGTYPAEYSIKLKPETRRRIKIINAHKDGLTDEIRLAIEEVVDAYYKMLSKELKDYDESA